MTDAVPNPSAAGQPETIIPGEDLRSDLLSALTNLGYNPMQASQAVAIAMKDLGDGADTAKLIRRGLKELAK